MNDNDRVELDFQNPEQNPKEYVPLTKLSLPKSMTEPKTSLSKVNRSKDVIAITACIAGLAVLFGLAGVYGGFLPLMMAIFIGSFTLGLVLSIGLLMSVRSVERAAARKRRGIREIQDRVINNSSASILDDLNQLIDLHMAAKNIDAAEIYSRQLCKAVEKPEHVVDEWMIADFCNMATPEHIKSWFGQFVFIYKAQGPIYLSDKKLIFKPKVKYVRKVGVVEIQLEEIVSITKGSYSRWAKPIRLDFLEIIYKSDGIEEGIIVTPMEFYSDTVWDSNKHVERWHTLIEQARAHRIHRIEQDRLARIAQLMLQMESSVESSTQSGSVQTGAQTT